MSPQEITISTWLGHCSACNHPIVLGVARQPEGFLEFVYDDDGNPWIMPHRYDCPKFIAASPAGRTDPGGAG